MHFFPPSSIIRRNYASQSNDSGRDATKLGTAEAGHQDDNGGSGGPGTDPSHHGKGRLYVDPEVSKNRGRDNGSVDKVCVIGVGFQNRTKKKEWKRDG